MNMYHDVMYHLGFDEGAGNYQENNNGRGGKEGDFVTGTAQIHDSYNNAYFLPKVDGRRSRMGLFMYTQPWRDSTFDSTIVLHELTHGVSDRLTGGPSNPRCLASNLAYGLGEGWSDAFANAFLIRAGDTRERDIVHGGWAANSTEGERSYAYSTNMTTNPLTFDYIKWFEAYDIGVFWATVLYDLLWDLVDVRGLDDDIWPTFGKDGLATNGRFFWIQLVTHAMTLQPCNPVPLQARDAVLDADEALTDGKYQCLLWKAFARRGMGVYATSSGTGKKGDPIKAQLSYAIPDDAC